MVLKSLTAIYGKGFKIKYHYTDKKKTNNKKNPIKINK